MIRFRPTSLFNFSFALLILAWFELGFATLPETTSTLDDQQSINVTIYNDNLALIKDTRQIQLQQGFNRIAFREVSANILAHTAILSSLTQPNSIQLLEQNFDFDLLTPQKLLEKYVGKTVTIIKTHPTTGEETHNQALVLSANNGVVLRIGDTIETGIPGRMVFKTVPKTLRDKPTLVVDLDLSANHPTTHSLELSYLSRGFSWQADYVAELSANDTTLELNAWVTLTNNSGTSYQNAALQLVAGHVNQVHEPNRQTARLRRNKANMAITATPTLQEETLFEYHLYRLARPTTLLDKQTKQVALLNASQIPVSKEYRLAGQDYYYRTSASEIATKQKVGVFLTFKNDQTSHLGIPLPKGVMRIYKKDSQKNIQFLGEDRIPHTSKAEIVRLKLGHAFDITASKKQTTFNKRAGGSRFNYEFESAYEITLSNAKTDDITVTIHEPIPGDWQMIKENHPHKKIQAHLAQWQIPVPAESKTTLKYRIRTRL